MIEANYCSTTTLLNKASNLFIYIKAFDNI